MPVEEKHDFVPSKWVNLFKLIVTPTVSRVAFGDAIIEKDAIFHTSITLSTADLKSLADTINKVLEEVPKDQEPKEGFL